MSQGYQQLDMVAQLGNDPSGLDEQQKQALALAQQQQLAQPQQQATIMQQQHNLEPPAQRPRLQHNTQLGVVQAMSQSPAPGASHRFESAHSQLGEDEELLSEDSLVVSPDAKQPRPARAGARSLSGSRTKSVKKDTITKSRSGSTERPPRMQSSFDGSW